MNKTTKLIDEMNEDRDFISKRKLLIIICILFMAMNVSGAKLVEANTFIFKINFTNTLGLGYLLFAGVITLTIRYYSVAYPYHVQIYDLWADAMMKDHRVFSYYVDAPELVSRGLLSEHSTFSHSFYPEDERDEKIIPNYRVSGVFKRSIEYTVDCGEYYSSENVCLRKFEKGWTVKHFFKMLAFEFEFQFNALFRRPESLEIMLPYIISLLSLLSFVFKPEIQAYLQ